MSAKTDEISLNRPEKIALDFALDKLLSPETKKEVMAFFELKSHVLMGSTDTLSREGIGRVLGMFFGFGASLILDEFNRKLRELETH